MKEYEYAFQAMGTDVSLSLTCEVQAHANTAFETFRYKINQYEKTYSRFLPDSTISKINTTGSAHVDDEFIDIMSKAIEQTENTSGCFNPLLQVKQLGYTTDFKMLQQQKTPENKNVYDTDITKVHIDINKHTVTLGPDQQLDFGGCLKGYIAEKLATEFMCDNKYQGVIVNLGGDLATYGVDDQQHPFMFEIWNPVTETDHAIPIKDSCLATSGTYKRTWHTTTGTTHHILDSAGANNVSTDVVSASVIGPSGLIAETLTKVLINTPLEEAVEKIPLLYQYLIIKKDGSTLSNIL